MIENIKNMLTEIEKMKAWCMDNYSNGADTMVECWTDADYENLFYHHNHDADTTHTLPRIRCTFAQAWDTLKSVASVYQDQQADAKNSVF
jgi:hypothetical protein